MNKQQILENIRVKSDLRYDLLFESAYYSTLDKGTQKFLKENYDRGVNLGLEILQNNPHLISENMDEAFWDRLKATGARAVQGVKNVTGMGAQTADSKDAGINSLFNSFKAKFDKTPGGAAAAVPSPQQPQQGGADQGANKVVQKTGKEIEDLDNETKNLPPIPPQQAAQMVQQANVPKSFKDKLMMAIRNNPGKTRLIIGGLSMAAGAAGTLVGVPPNISGAIVNGIGSAIVNKAQGKSAMAGLVQGGLSGLALGSMGAGISDFIANGITNLGTQAVTQAAASKAAGSFVPTDAGEDAALQASQNYTPMEPGDPGYTDPNNASGGAYPFDQTNPNKLYPDTGATTNQSFPGTQTQDIVPGSANDPDQGMLTSPMTTSQQAAQGFQPGTTPITPDVTPDVQPAVTTQPTVPRSADAADFAKPRWTRTAAAGLDQRGAQMLSRREENVNLFTKTGKNNFKLQRNILNEALTDEQKALVQDFINDLAKKLNQSPQTVIQFMKSQGDRFKHILDYLPSDAGGNRNMAGQQPQQGQQPGQPGQPQQGQLITGPVTGPGASNVSPALIKNINTLKGSKLFAGNLEGRIAALLNVKYEVPTEKTKFDAFLKSLNGIVNAQSANVKKKIGDPNSILATLKEAEIKDYLSVGQDISAIMPVIIDTAFLLRQAFSKKNPNAVTQKQPQAGDVGFNKFAPHTLPKGVQPGQVNEQLKISVQELTTIKYFLSQLIQVGNLVKNTNIQDPTQLKNLFRGILTLTDIVANKNVKGVKLNNKVDSGFQGKDILGAGASDKPEKQVKKGPGDIFKNKDAGDNKSKAPNVPWSDPRSGKGGQDDARMEESQYKLKDYKKFFI